jgi:hypothetical protein
MTLFFVIAYTVRRHTCERPEGAWQSPTYKQIATSLTFLAMTEEI